ncbi:hypothetical protein HNR25_004717 [Streptomonospora salina]|uniref:Uncharacterized protein n=1 Tax=Streptomonospora salina TaxID=104205 RepID=A0A841EJB2_9ACTN|nr:hypothetical protein [Streptomonospora salina]
MTVHGSGRPLVLAIELSEVETDVPRLDQRLAGGRHGLIDIGEPDGSGLAVIDHKGGHGVFRSLVDAPEHAARRASARSRIRLRSVYSPAAMPSRILTATPLLEQVVEHDQPLEEVAAQPVGLLDGEHVAGAHVVQGCPQGGPVGDP